MTSENTLPRPPAESTRAIRDWFRPDSVLLTTKSVKPGKRQWRPWTLVVAVFFLVAVVVLAIILPVYFLVLRPQQLSAIAGGGNPGTSGNTDGKVTGGDGSQVTTDIGVEFTYHNKLGGYWYYNPANPFDNSARAQSYSPALNQTWRYGVDRVYGVNLGGWLVIEPFIAPALFEKYLNLPNYPVDEYTLSQTMRNDTTSGGGISQLEDHYRTFITEEDFAQIAGAGLNWVRIPLPFWAVETVSSEPYLTNVSWKYFLKAIHWARKYGLRINLDLHTLPGAQNPWNHSGKQNSINWLNGVMGVANAQRSLNHIRAIAEFIAQPQYRDVVPYFGIVNEPRTSTDGSPGVPITALKSFYFEAYKIVRRAGGGTWVGFHDGFIGLSEFYGFLHGATRTGIDIHLYSAFSGPSIAPLSSVISAPCNWNGDITTSMQQFGFTNVGEWSLAVNDCGKWVNGVARDPVTSYEQAFGKGSCAQWTGWETWDAQKKSDLKKLMLASLDGAQNSFFWTWKIGNSSVSNRVEAPLWSYRLAWEQGWAPLDPHIESTGACNNLGTPITPFAGKLNYTSDPSDSSHSPNNGTTSVDPNQLSQWGIFPPLIIGEVGAAQVPRYTPTGTIAPLPVPTEFVGTDPGDGWNNDVGDAKTGAYVPIAGCTYPDEYQGENVPVPPLCVG